jgi:23S rRNA (guanosine2251-2'-O)-methyltransferase
VLATADRAPGLRKAGGAERLQGLEIVEAAEIARELPQGAVHQGAALLGPLPEPTPLEALAADARGVLLMLDQVTDPQNVGAIFRTAAAFGARGVILQDRHAPALAGALAKASAGAVDRVPHARVVNLSRALEALEEHGWRAVGLAGEADETLDTVLDARPTVLVLGSEGEGLRRLVAEHCDALARIAMPGGFESLNVSAAAAVALYEASKPRG